MHRAQLLDPDLDQKVRQTLETRITKLYNRLTAGAQPGLGAPWDAVLRKLTDDPELDKELRQEDFYHLTTNGVKGEWLVEAAQKMLCRPKAEAAALGWPRAKTAYKQVAAQLGFMKGVYERGHELLEEWGVYENRAAQRKEKEEAFLEGTFKEAWMRNLFTKKGGKTWKEYTWWMAFADFPEGYQYRMFLTVAQDKKNKKELREHAAKRAVIG